MKKTLITILISVISLVSFAQNAMDDKIKTLANEIADQVAKSGKKTVAVSALTYKDANTEFGKLLAEKLSGKLAISGRGITVVNQKMLAELLKQNKLTAEGILIAKNEAAKLGLASGIEALVYGVISSFGEELQLTVNIVELKTTNVFGNAEVSFPLTTAIKNMLINTDFKEVETDTDINLKDDKTSKKSSADCATKRTCTICVTNKFNDNIIVSGWYDGAMPDKLIHTGKTECWSQVNISANEDFGRKRICYYVGDTRIKVDDIIIEPCNIYTYTFSK